MLSKWGKGLLSLSIAESIPRRNAMIGEVTPYQEKWWCWI